MEKRYSRENTTKDIYGATFIAYMISFLLTGSVMLYLFLNHNINEELFKQVWFGAGIVCAIWMASGKGKNDIFALAACVGFGVAALLTQILVAIHGYFYGKRIQDYYANGGV